MSHRNSIEDLDVIAEIIRSELSADIVDKGMSKAMVAPLTCRVEKIDNRYLLSITDPNCCMAYYGQWNAPVKGTTFRQIDAPTDHTTCFTAHTLNDLTVGLNRRLAPYNRIVFSGHNASDIGR